jgi:hemin uptake protein HemP
MNIPVNLSESLGDRAPVNHDADAFERRFVVAAPARMANVRSITSEQLFAEFPEVQITHGDAVYRLRQTSLGKLILTK